MIWTCVQHMHEWYTAWTYRQLEFMTANGQLFGSAKMKNKVYNLGKESYNLSVKNLYEFSRDSAGEFKFVAHTLYAVTRVAINRQTDNCNPRVRAPKFDLINARCTPTRIIVVCLSVCVCYHFSTSLRHVCDKLSFPAKLPMNAKGFQLADFAKKPSVLRFSAFINARCAWARGLL